MRLSAATAVVALTAAYLTSAAEIFTEHFSGWEGDARSCTLCLEEASSQTGCSYTDPSGPEFNFECLCQPASQATTQGCSGFCQGTKFSKDSQCAPAAQAAKRAVSEEVEIVNKDARSCDLCLEQAAQQSNCENNNASMPGYDFDCLCKQPTLSDHTKGCTNFCESTKYDIDAQCDARSNATSQGDVAETEEAAKLQGCTICLEEASAQTSCGKASGSGFKFDCLCSSVGATTGCTTLCNGAPHDILANCTAIIANVPSTPATKLPARTAQDPPTTPSDLGFCGPKGGNCKFTEYAGAGTPLVDRATSLEDDGKHTFSKRVSGSSCYHRAGHEYDLPTQTAATPTAPAQTPTALVDKRENITFEIKEGKGGGGDGGGKGGNHSSDATAVTTPLGTTSNFAAIAAWCFLALAFLV